VFPTTGALSTYAASGTAAGPASLPGSASAGQAAGVSANLHPSASAPGRHIPMRPCDRGARPCTAFVFAGGASLGALQVGMLRALYERGITADVFVGTSVGALNAAYIASRPQTLSTVLELEKVWRELHRSDIFPVHPMTLIGGLANTRDSLVPGRAFRRFISRHLELERLDDATVPLHLVGFDLLSGKEVRLSAGSALQGVLAASAIPGILPPVRWGKHLLIDGGVTNNTPISHAVELGARRIYILATNGSDDRALPVAPHGALDVAVHALTRLFGERLRGDLIRYADAAELVVLPAANPDDVQPTDFGHADELILAALDAARTTLGHPMVHPLTS
jgi:NTE family protein